MIVRVPLLTLANPGQIAIAEGINLGVASSDSADAAGWPFTAADAVFDAPAALFDLAVWQPPTGATGCLTSGIDGRAECQVAPAAH